VSRLKLVNALRMMDRKQSIVEDTHGNVSCRDHDTIYIKPSGMEYGLIQESDVVECDLKTGAVEGTRRPSVDLEHHRSIYLRNPRVGAICHTHSPHATAWAISGMHMPVMCTEHADYFGHTIRCLPFSSLDSWGWIELSGIEQAVLLERHGIITCSDERDPVQAVKLAAALEAIAKKYYIAAYLNRLPDPMSEYETQKWHDRYTQRYGQ
jgi:L-ribulose-5-phosphate 4-epimerase